MRACAATGRRSGRICWTRRGRADGLVLGPAATFDFRDEAKGEINPSMFFRKGLDLFANIRPARTYPGLPDRLGAFDLVVVRENTEGFYADRNMASGSGEMLVTPEVVGLAAADHARHAACGSRARPSNWRRARKRRVTAVHKANVLKIGDGMFLDDAARSRRTSRGRARGGSSSTR